MQIPAFDLPSNPEKQAFFRMPTVKDAMTWANASPETEEANISRYLSEILADPTSHDVRSWTGQDRWTALWWIFINSRLNPTITVQYPCEHCKETHFYDCNMERLMDMVGMLTVEPFIAVEIPVNGIAYQWQIKPLNGYELEHIERARLSLPGEDDPNYKTELLALEILEYTHQAHLADEPDDFMKAAEFRHELISTMALDTEFSVLMANVELAKRTLAHGLEMRTVNGETSLLLPDHACPTISKDKGEAAAPMTRLFTPFRSGNFLPVIRPGRLGNNG
ncbi:hypothetical protein QMM96_22495 [Citrobacter freundii]|uniref:hypothetical protein n=1 Tax=Citrobacter freundii TaxID=546 RepID=UPI002B24EFA3|nr:hypothetical protein [Citrobacter freundii]MEB2478203.1 hypothetical protein [Citrobacter freundii]